MDRFPDWQPAPNISSDPATYELENEALARDRRLDQALEQLAPWTGRTLLDIGCGTGFWLPHYAKNAASAIGVEPDPSLAQLAVQRAATSDTIDVRLGSAEHLPIDDSSIDIAHARFAYFFGEGAEAGLTEVSRVLRPGGVLLAVDNSWNSGEFAQLLRAATTGNAAIDPTRTEHWWNQHGAIRHEVEGGWQATSIQQLETILRLEFPDKVVDQFMTHQDRSDLTYNFAIYEWSKRSWRRGLARSGRLMTP